MKQLKELQKEVSNILRTLCAAWKETEPGTTQIYRPTARRKRNLQKEYERTGGILWPGY